MISIYGLIDPRTKTIRYIGKTTDTDRRLRQHLADTDNTAKVRWVSELKLCGLLPELVILDSAETDRDASYRETWWIVLARKQGWRLVNGTFPGERRADFGDMFCESLRRIHSNAIVGEFNSFIDGMIKSSFPWFVTPFALLGIVANVYNFSGESIRHMLIWPFVFFSTLTPTIGVVWLIYLKSLRSHLKGVQDEAR